MTKVFDHSLNIYLVPMRFSFVGISSSTSFLLFYWVLNSSFSQSYDDTDPDIETPANLGLKKRW